ncbi:hypothetical protein DES35_101915 [Schleiferia thermophila]|uniref:Uncharacterized protein n=1 Tax=Schleiferia thermophila TaxID=884107 RepID=A0A369AC11_9FLAO|nr:hypothetical protein DES35_101915 [Schleiferia thermophila]
MHYMSKVVVHVCCALIFRHYKSFEIYQIFFGWKFLICVFTSKLSLETNQS